MRHFTQGLGQFDYYQQLKAEHIKPAKAAADPHEEEIQALFQGFIQNDFEPETARELVRLKYPDAFLQEKPATGGVELDQLYKWPFNVAHKYVLESSTPEQRLEWGEQTSKLLGQLYELTKLYGNNRSPKDMERGIIHMSPDEFQRLMNKIKHYETLLGWFYETDMSWLDEEMLNLDILDL